MSIFANLKAALRRFVSVYTAESRDAAQAAATRNLKLGYYMFFIVEVSLLSSGIVAFPLLLASTTLLAVALSSILSNNERLLEDNDPMVRWYRFWKIIASTIGAVSLVAMFVLLNPAAQG